MSEPKGENQKAGIQNPLHLNSARRKAGDIEDYESRTHKSTRKTRRCVANIHQYGMSLVRRAREFTIPALHRHSNGGSILGRNDARSSWQIKVHIPPPQTPSNPP